MMQPRERAPRVGPLLPAPEHVEGASATASDGNLSEGTPHPHLNKPPKVKQPRGHGAKVEKRRGRGFRRAQFVLAVVVLGCLLWTLWLLVLTAYPDATMNYVMRTKMLDNGSFWLMAKPGLPLVLIGGAGFTLVASGYLWTLVELTMSRKSKPSQPSQGPTEAVVRRSSLNDRLSSVRSAVSSIRVYVGDSIAHAATDPARNSATHSAATIMLDVLIREDSSARKHTVRGAELATRSACMNVITRTCLCMCVLPCHSMCS